MNNNYPIINKHLWTPIDYQNPNIAHEDYEIVGKINKEYFYKYIDKETMSLHLNERNKRFEGIKIQINKLL